MSREDIGALPIVVVSPKEVVFESLTWKLDLREFGIILGRKRRKLVSETGLHVATSVSSRPGVEANESHSCT